MLKNKSQNLVKQVTKLKNVNYFKGLGTYFDKVQRMRKLSGLISDEFMISKEKMENIIFDIMILNASNGFDLKIDNNLLSDELIYKKHNIDSLQFFESELYYSKNPREHYEIYAKVKIRILKSIDSLKNIN